MQIFKVRRFRFQVSSSFSRPTAFVKAAEPSVKFQVLLLTFLLLLPLGRGLAFAQKVSILGDSYSTFEGYMTCDTNHIWYFKGDSPAHNKRNDVAKVEETWWHQFISSTKGLTLEKNNSFSGATICYSGYKKGNEPRVPIEGLTEHRDYSNRSFVSRSNTLGNPDIILVCGGTNDSWCGAPMGDYVYGNWTTEQLYYFRPAMAKLLYDLKGNYPTAKILFILNSELRESINESVHTICKHYDVQCLDLKDIDKQAGHPSVKGMTAFAQQVKKALQ